MIDQNLLDVAFHEVRDYGRVDDVSAFQLEVKLVPQQVDIGY